MKTRIAAVCAVCAVLALAACAPNRPVNLPPAEPALFEQASKVRVGMTVQEVIAILGQPRGTAPVSDQFVLTWARGTEGFSVRVRGETVTWVSQIPTWSTK